MQPAVTARPASEKGIYRGKAAMKIPVGLAEEAVEVR